jgi:uncharacterized protein YlxP (DUF503 family)
MFQIAVTLDTLESHNHLIGDIPRGVKIYEDGGVEFMEPEPNYYIARVPHKRGTTKTVAVTFTQDGRDIEQSHCDCSWRSGGNPVCRHVTAAVLTIQGGIVEPEDIVGTAKMVKTVSSGISMTTLSSILTFYIPQTHSLKDKRIVARSIMDKARHRFNASVAEVASQDLHQTLTLGVAVVSGEYPHARKQLDELVRFMEENADAELVNVEEM